MTTFEPTAEHDLSLFADLGTPPPRAATAASGTIVRMVRNGSKIELVLRSDGSVEERDESGQRKHADIRALLASPNFGDLGRWADAQTTLLKDRVSREEIPILGLLSGHEGAKGVEAIDDNLVPHEDRDGQRVRILLVDGPAGIGKTSIIRKLSYRRASSYRVSRRPLILHVESRGRMLQNIADLMAFSLQTLRLSVTYDQVPVLVRRGLVTLAIDGFDELGDPNGYELAWAQVNDLIADVRGSGSLLLAGRETFIGRDRLIAALKGFRSTSDELHTFTVRPIMPDSAKYWLRSHGWTDDLFAQENVEPLFEAESYALRPFFLEELGRPGVPERVREGVIDDLTWFLVETMISREATKFGSDVEAATTEVQRRSFVRRFLGEVARDLAENQTEAIGSDTLAWIAELVANETVPSGLVGILKNRAGVVAFLADDDRPGYKRFSHAQLLNHFLARITVEAVLSDEVPKYVRRNIFGADFLVSFTEVVRNTSVVQIRRFLQAALAGTDKLADQDRSRRNLAALVLAAISAIEDVPGLRLTDVAIDEALVTGTAGSITLKGVVIAQLDARGTDLRAMTFDQNCHVISLIADAATALPPTFPQPQRVQLPGAVLTNPAQISQWILAPLPSTREANQPPLVPSELRGHGLIELVGRVCRYRPFWIRDGDESEKAARRILDDSYWNTLRIVLENHDLLTVRKISAAGKPSLFFHVRRKDRIVSESSDDPQIVAFYKDIVDAIRAEDS